MQSSDTMQISMSLLDSVVKHNRRVSIKGHIEDTIYVNTPDTIEFITEGNCETLGSQYNPQHALAMIDYRTGLIVTGDTVEQLCNIVGLKYNYWTSNFKLHQQQLA